MNWLAEIREKRGFTQNYVAENAKISRAAYGNIETGVRRPSVPMAKRIASVLGFNWTKFYEEGDK